MMHSIVVSLQNYFVLYFAFTMLVYFSLTMFSIFYMRNYLHRYPFNNSHSSAFSGLEPSISVLLPAFNEEKIIVQSINGLLKLVYNNYEVLVINDGSTDKTLETIRREFKLQLSPRVYVERIKTQPVHAVYYSALYPRLTVIDKDRGNKGDALNAGINQSRCKLICSVDADSLFSPVSLLRAVQSFIEDDTTVASGGQLRLLNGCEVKDGVLTKVKFPDKWLARLQVIEYLRAFFFGRMGWAWLNALSILSGAFAIFDKKEIIFAGGYHTYTAGEDLEIMLRLHRLLSSQKRKYRIVFVPDSFCWTTVPQTLADLGKQRMKWH